MTLPSCRDYEREVRNLRILADGMLFDGIDPENVARKLVDLRNAIKARYRAHDDPAIFAVMEMRNRVKYGDPLGPDADALFSKYGSWLLVIQAACRPARLADP